MRDGFVSLLIIAALLVAFGVTMGTNHPHTGAGAAAYFVLAAFSTIGLALLISVLAHEGGHLLGGWLAGSRFFGLMIGPLEIINANGKHRAVLSKWTLRGSVLMAPLDARHLRRREFIFTLGGPLAGLALAGLALLVSQHIHADQGWRYAVHHLARATFFVSALVSTASLIPRKGGSGRDGTRLFIFLRGGTRARSLSVYRCLWGGMQTHIRPRMWDEALINDLLANPVTPGSYLYFAHIWALDRGEIEWAREYLDQLLDDEPDTPQKHRAGALEHVFWPTQQEVILEIAYFQARYTQDTALAQQALEELPERERRSAIAACARAALMLAEGLYAELSQYVLEILDQGQQWPDTVFTQMCTEWLQDMAFLAEEQPPAWEGSE